MKFETECKLVALISKTICLPYNFYGSFQSRGDVPRWNEI